MRCAAGKCANKFSVFLSHYADDTQLWVALSKKTVNDAVTYLLNCLFNVHTWFSQNGLVINPDKSEAVLLSTAQHARASTSPLTDVNVAGCIAPLTDTVKLFGVTTDRHLAFVSHVQNICKSAYYQYNTIQYNKILLI